MYVVAYGSKAMHINHRLKHQQMYELKKKKILLENMINNHVVNYTWWD